MAMDCLTCIFQVRNHSSEVLDGRLPIQPIGSFFFGCLSVFFSHSSPDPSNVMRSLHSWGGYRSLQNGIVAIVIIFSAYLLYQRFLPEAPSLWYSAVHDRNGHYRRSQGFASAFREGSIAGVLHQIHAATVWPPLHPLVTGLVLAVGGLDYRLAVLPSLAAWVATCWFAFALAYRLAPHYQGLAGGVALLFTLASPAHRAYATDIMLESMGAALTLAALHFYVRARQEASAWSGRCFALIMLALFLTKYNYWTLLTAGLLLGALCEFRAPLWDYLATWWHSCTSPNQSVAGYPSKRFYGQLGHPLNHLVGASFALAFSVRFVGPLRLTVLRQDVEIETLDFPAQLCFLFLLLRVLPWWWRCGRYAAARLPVPARQLVAWHIYPLAFWFLWPRRLGVFLWYVTFTQHGRSVPWSPWMGNFSYYRQCLMDDYHATFASLVLALVLIALAVIGRRRAVGQLPVFVFLASAALLTNYHSATRSRFLHSWLAVGWVVAGVGAAQGIERINRHILPVLMPAGSAAGHRIGIGGRACRLIPRVLLGSALAGLACLHGSALVVPGHSEEGGTQNTQPSLLPIADAVCPELLRSHEAAVVSNEPFAWLLNWRLAEYPDFEDKRRLPPIRELPPEALRGASAGQIDAWLRQTSCDLLLLINGPVPQDPRGCPSSEMARCQLGSLESSTPAAEWHFSAPLNVIVQIWRSSGRGGYRLVNRTP